MVAEHEWSVRIQSLISLPRYNAHFVYLGYPVPERRKLRRRALQSQDPRSSSIRYIWQCAHRIRIVRTSVNRWVVFQNLCSPFRAAKFTRIFIRTSSIINHHAPHSPKQPVMFDNLTLTSCCVYPTHKKSTVSARNSRPCIIRVHPYRTHA